MLLNPIKYFVFNMFHSFSTHLRDIHIIPMFSDNYGYLLIDKSSNSAAIIDPGDAFVFPAVKNKLNVDVKMILNTHKHNDHVGGNLKLLEMYEGVKVYGPKNEPIPGILKPFELLIIDLKIYFLFSLQIIRDNKYSMRWRCY